MTFVFRLLICLPLLSPVFAQQKTIKPITDDCKHSMQFPVGNGFSVNFCRPESAVLSDYLQIQKDVETTTEDGKAVLSDTYHQLGPHWELSASISKFKDGHPLGLGETKERIIREWRQNNEVLDIAMGPHNECYGISVFRGTLRNKDGNKVFIKAILHRDEMLLVQVTTYCKKDVCDPDKYGYALLNNFAQGPGAYDPKCGYL